LSTDVHAPRDLLDNVDAKPQGLFLTHLSVSALFRVTTTAFAAFNLQLGTLAPLVFELCMQVLLGVDGLNLDRWCHAALASAL